MPSSNPVAAISVDTVVPDMAVADEDHHAGGAAVVVVAAAGAVAMVNDGASRGQISASGAPYPASLAQQRAISRRTEQPGW